MSVFESYRLKSPIVLPKALRASSFEAVYEKDIQIGEQVASQFAHLRSCHVHRLVATSGQVEPLRVGVVLSGGQAPGGHNVIAGIFDTLAPGSLLVGFLGGLKGLIFNTYKELGPDEIDAVRNIGGFHLLGSGRTKIDSLDEIERAMRTIDEHRLDGLVIIGGDDSNTDAAYLAEAIEASGRKTVVVGVPKTIDGDLRGPDVPISFGFDTACKTYSSIIGNISRDLISSKKYYHFIRLMGRQASHITLECALQTQPNLAFISEEVREKSVHEVVCEIADLVESRAEQGLHYGLVLVPEGLIEHMLDMRQLIEELNELFAPEHELAALFNEALIPSERIDLVRAYLSEKARRCLALFPRHIAEALVYERDPHGNVQVSRIETERLLAHLVSRELQTRRRKKEVPFAWQSVFLGYEGRSAYPSYFDCHYGYCLGKLSAILVANDMNGYMASLANVHKEVEAWEPIAVPLVSLMHVERRLGKEKAVIRKEAVDLSGEVFSLFEQRRRHWRVQDSYLHPGPIQFQGPDEVVKSPCFSIVASVAS